MEMEIEMEKNRIIYFVFCRNFLFSDRFSTNFIKTIFETCFALLALSIIRVE